MRRLLLRLYPARWRARYGEELMDLLDDTGLSARAALNLAGAGLAERGRVAVEALTGGTTMVFGPAWRHPTAWALAAGLVLLPTFLFVSISMLTYQFGLTGLASVADPLNTWLDSQRILDLLLVAAPALAVLLAGLPLLRVSITTDEGGRLATIGVRLRTANFVIGVVAVLTGAVLLWHIVFEAVLQVGA